MNFSAMPKWVLPTIAAVLAIVVAFAILTGSRQFQQRSGASGSEVFVAGIPDILARSENARSTRMKIVLSDAGEAQRDQLRRSVSEIASRARSEDNMGLRSIRQLEEIALEKSEPLAMLELGNLFASQSFNGYSPIKAYSWYTLAAGFRSGDAMQRRVEIAELLSERELEKGQAAAEKLLQRIQSEGN